MKILMCGDTHGDQTHLQHLIRTAKDQDCDRIFVLGDFGFWSHMTEGVRFLDKLSRFCGNEGIPTYFLDGNHDKTSLILDLHGGDLDPEGFLKVREHVRYAPRGHRWTWDGVSLISLGGAYSVDKAYRLGKQRYEGQLWFPEEEMSDEDMAAILAADPSPVDVLLAHDKPRGSSPHWNRKDFHECYPNQDRLQLAVKALTPKMFLHGHLHYRYSDAMQYSDLSGNHRVCHVVGLACNPDSMENRIEAAKRDSRMVFDTEYFNATRGQEFDEMREENQDEG